MIIRQLGSCYGIVRRRRSTALTMQLGSMSALVLPRMVKRIRDPNELHDTLLTFFGVLAFFDIVHMFVEITRTRLTRQRADDVRSSDRRLRDAHQRLVCALLRQRACSRRANS